MIYIYMKVYYNEEVFSISGTSYLNCHNKVIEHFCLTESQYSDVVTNGNLICRVERTSL